MLNWDWFTLWKTINFTCIWCGKVRLPVYYSTCICSLISTNVKEFIGQCFPHYMLKQALNGVSFFLLSSAWNKTTIIWKISELDVQYLDIWGWTYPIFLPWAPAVKILGVYLGLGTLFLWRPMDGSSFSSSSPFSVGKIGDGNFKGEPGSILAFYNLCYKINQANSYSFYQRKSNTKSTTT